MDLKVEGSELAGATEEGSAARGRAPVSHRLPQRLSLSSKLLILTTAFVMLAEILIFVPSVANYRVTWLMDRLRAAQLASLSAEASPDGNVPAPLRDELLRAAQVRAVALKRNDQRQLILSSSMPHAVDASYDISRATASMAERAGVVWDAMQVLFSTGNRTIRVVGQPGEGAGSWIEIVLPEAPLRAAMVKFGLNVLGLSVIISMITAALVYLALNTMLVRPMMRLAGNMQRFSERPEDRSRIISPSERGDEIGTAERELAHMQTELAHLLQQRSRLAALGLAVSKINHDLRNLLANAQLLSDRLVATADPTVERFAPKLIASLDRAIAFCNDTLRYGRAEEPAPRRAMVALKPLVEEVADGLGLPTSTSVVLKVAIEEGTQIDCDRDQMFRVLSNLMRNAVQAIEALQLPTPGAIEVVASRSGKIARIVLADDGPGIPERARVFLFQAFQGSVRKGGTGLGLAIARELVVAHGGEIRLIEAERGTRFEIEIPDRPVAG